MTYEAVLPNPASRGLSNFGQPFQDPRVFRAPPSGAVIGNGLEELDRLQAVERKLLALDYAFFEDYSRSLSDQSREAFSVFMRHQPQANLPLLGAESDGNLVATWEKEDACLTIRFAGRYEIDFAISVGIGEGAQRRWGKSQIAFFVAEHTQAARIISR
jgi:hypothetical protein